jgi:hypothetical protein
VTTLPKPGKDPKFPQKLRPISLLPSTGKVFEKVLLEIVKRHIGENNLLNASQFGFRARHSATLQCMRLADHVTPLFADDTCLYATDRKEGYVLRKIQRVLNCMAEWCERWNIKVNEQRLRRSTSLIEIDRLILLLR